jgi:hypothetical protein
MTHETRRCSVEGCPNLAAYEVMLYDFDVEEGGVRFARDESCPYLCLEHARDNERGADGRRIGAPVEYPYTNRDRVQGVSLYLDLRPADAA